MLEEKYSEGYKKALGKIQDDRKSWKIGFIDVDETVDLGAIENIVEEKLGYPQGVSLQSRYEWKKNIKSRDTPCGYPENKSGYPEDTGGFENLVVLWIGWSALWTLSIHQAIKGKNWNLLSDKQRRWFLRLFVVDNVDPKKIQDTLDVIDLEKTLFVVISKSGGTIETKSLFKFFKEKVKENISLFQREYPKGEGLEQSEHWNNEGLEHSNRNIEDHFIVIAWEESDFKRKYELKWYTTLWLAGNIWGRFSVLTNVWLLPLAFCWIDIRGLMKWVSDSKKNMLSAEIKKNPALLSALIHHYTYREAGKNIQVFFPYVDSLLYFWEWYKQLVWESLGKWWSWVTTTTAVWVTDQHSQLQLYFDGPNDKLLIFLEVADFGVDYEVWKYTFGDLMKYEKFGTEKSVTDYNKLNYTLKLQKIDEQTLWALILMCETQTAIIGELSWINTYNQPGVEIGKRITKMKLKEVFGKSVVTIGWGNGHSNILAWIKSEFMDKINLKAIVSMSDDWRTTWRLMKAFKQDLNIDFPPPGDLRRCLYFMSNSKYKANIETYFETVFPLDIPVKELSVKEMFKFIWIRGKLLQEFIELSGKEFLDFKLPLDSSIEWFKLWNILMWVLYYNYDLNYNRVMDFMHNLLKVEAQVIPVTTDSACMEAELENWEIIQTQDAISNGADYDSPIREVRLMEKSQGANHNVDIETSLTDADYIIISPGDLYTSTISNLIIWDMKEMIQNSSAKIIFIWNTTNKWWETQDFSLMMFVEKLEQYLWKEISYFVVNNKKLELQWDDLEKMKNNISVKGWEYIFLSEKEKNMLEARGTVIVWEDLIDRESFYKHNNKKLAKVLKKIIL